MTPLQDMHSADRADGASGTDGVGSSDTANTGEETATIDHVVTTALRMFAERGFHDTKLDAIAKATGMSKRKLHYNFGDKKGLYARALLRGLENLRPPETVLERSHAVPVEGMRRFIDALFMAIKDHPESVQILLREQMDPALDDAESVLSQRSEDVILHLERLLLAGQDIRAFRPDVSANDVLLLLISICIFPASTGAVAQGLRGVDFNTARNITGMRRLVIDAVIAFLTTNISPSGYDSYLEAAPPTNAADSAIADDYLGEPDSGIY